MRSKLMPVRATTSELGETGARAAFDGFQRRLTAPSARPALIATGYLAWLTAAELLSSVGEPRIGLILHASLLIALIYHAARALDEPLHRLLLTRAFAR